MPRAISCILSRLDINTQQQIKDLIAAPDEIKLPLAADSVVENSSRNVSYKLSTAILPTPGHFQALLKHGDRYYKVSDAHRPTLAGRLDIRRAEIYVFIRVENDDDFM